jgi:hypothetical protein
MYLQVWKKIAPIAFYAFLTIMVLVDLVVVDKRYFTKDNFKRKYEASFEMNESDQEILKDKSYYRVYNLQDIQNPFGEARTSFYHNSLSGYSGAKMRRYQDLYDSCMYNETVSVINKLRSGSQDFSDVGVLNMLNTKYFLFGPARNNVLENTYACGNAWFVYSVEQVNNANDELDRTGKINTQTTAVTSDKRFSGKINTDSSATISLTDQKPYWLKYESNTASGGLAVFSEIYYPEGWSATIDGNATPILKVNYTLRAIEVPAGKHTIEFTFAPKAYIIGDKITMASNGLVILLLLGTIFFSIKKENE